MSSNKNRNWMELLGKEERVNAILKTSEGIEKYGLSITKKDAEELAVAGKNSLKEQRRVEFNGGIMPKLISEFCDSSYIQQDNFMEILTQLQDIFYQYKNEMMDEITDDELIHFMKEQFETICYGDLEYLAGTCLNNFATAIRAGYQDYQKTDGYGAYHSLDDVTRWDFGLYEQALRDLEG